MAASHELFGLTPERTNHNDHRYTKPEQPPFPSSPSFRTVLAVQGPLRRAKPARPGPSGPFRTPTLEKGKGATAKAKPFSVCGPVLPPAGRPDRKSALPLDDANNLQA